MDLALYHQSDPVLVLFYRLDNTDLKFTIQLFLKKICKYRYVSMVLSWILNTFSLKKKHINAVMHLSHICFL